MIGGGGGGSDLEEAEDRREEYGQKITEQSIGFSFVIFLLILNKNFCHILDCFVYILIRIDGAMSRKWSNIPIYLIFHRWITCRCMI